jgi:hypothetical protein
MAFLNEDVILLILEYSESKDKLNFISTCQYFNTFKFKVQFNDPITNSNIKDLLYYDRFTNIILDCFKKLPASITHLTFEDNFNQEIKDYILQSDLHNLTHLTFGHHFNKEIKDRIPLSVTHLTFGFCFNQEIKDCITDSVTHLTFGTCFNQEIKDCLPDSVTHLTFALEFNKEIKGCIPRSVTHLTFSTVFKK